MSNRLLVLGDVHGAARALTQVLDRSNFDPASDRLIFLGDICDGYPETPQAIDILLDIPDRVVIEGNHDEWFRAWVKYGVCDPIWYFQGGDTTISAYNPIITNWLAARGASGDVPKAHESFLDEMVPYYIEDDFAFTHGGFSLHGVKIAPPGGYNWDRALWEFAQASAKFGMYILGDYKRVFIGHTSTGKYSTKPVLASGVWNIDQGAGFEGKLTLMDVHTEEYWQSDLTSELYK